jgi:hypothetical protein
MKAVRPKSDRCRSRPWGCLPHTKLPRRGSLRGVAYAILLRKPSPLELPPRGRPVLHTLPQRREAASKNSSQGSLFAFSPAFSGVYDSSAPSGLRSGGPAPLWMLLHGASFWQSSASRPTLTSSSLRSGRVAGGEYRRSRYQRVGTYDGYRIAVASCVYMVRHHTRQRRRRCKTMAGGGGVRLASV